MEADERIQKFIELCDNSSFPHKEDLMSGIESGKYLLSNYHDRTVSATQLLNIYSARAVYLRKRISTNEVRGVHPEELLRDSERLVEELTSAQDERVNSWTFSIDGSSSYEAFVGVDRKKILGCLLTVDKLTVSESEWDELWGKD